MSTDLIPLSPSPLAQAATAADAAAAEQVFADYRRRRAAETLRRQRADLALFARFLEAAGVRPAPDAEALATDPAAWRGISWGLVAAWRLWLLRQGYAVGSVNVRLSTLRTYAALAAQAGALAAGELTLIKAVGGYSAAEARRLDAQRSPTRRGRKKAEAVALTPAQLKRLRQQPDTPQGRRDAVLVALLADLGLRVGEAVALRVRDVDLAAGLLTVYRSKVSLLQTHRLTNGLLAALRRYLEQDAADPDAPLLRASTRSDRLTAEGMTARAAAKRVRELGQRIGATNLSPHDLRHTWATLAARNGTPLDRLQDAGGWASPAMPMRYVERARIANEGVRVEE